MEPAAGLAVCALAWRDSSTAAGLGARHRPPLALGSLVRDGVPVNAQLEIACGNSLSGQERV